MLRAAAPLAEVEDDAENDMMRSAAVAADLRSAAAAADFRLDVFRKT
jgi:hypothetical protein